MRRISVRLTGGRHLHLERVLLPWQQVACGGASRKPSESEGAVEGCFGGWPSDKDYDTSGKFDNEPARSRPNTRFLFLFLPGDDRRSLLGTLRETESRLFRRQQWQILDPVNLSSLWVLLQMRICIDQEVRKQRSGSLWSYHLEPWRRAVVCRVLGLGTNNFSRSFSISQACCILCVCGLKYVHAVKLCPPCVLSFFCICGCEQDTQGPKMTRVSTVCQ